MDLNHPGSDLLRESEALTLLVLHRLPDGASGREIARIAGKDSHASVQRALKRLAVIGLVDYSEIGTSTIYKLNREHVYWKAVFEILASPAKVEERLGEIVGSFENGNITAAVFGSYARGEAGMGSDLDVLVVVPDDFLPEERERLSDKLTSELGTLTGNEIQVVDLTVSTVQRMVASGDPLIESWLRDSRTVVGPNLAELIEAAKG